VRKPCVHTFALNSCPQRPVNRPSRNCAFNRPSALSWSPQVRHQSTVGLSHGVQDLIGIAAFSARSTESAPAKSIQSPYIHRASGLAQIAVSTSFRLNAQADAEVVPAERCRYGTRDLASTDLNASGSEYRRFGFTPLLVPHGHYRINTGCPERRDRAGQENNHRQNCYDSR